MTPGVTDSAGGVSNAAAQTLYTTWAKVEPKSSTWLQLQGIQVLGNTYEIIVRYAGSRSVTTENIIEYEGKDLIVKSYREVNEGKKRYLKLLAYEQTLGGSGTSNGGSNYNPSGTYKWEKGTPMGEVPVGYDKMYQFSYSDLGNKHLIWTMRAGSVIDWGDETGIWSYPDGTFPEKVYQVESADVKIYHNDGPLVDEVTLSTPNNSGVCDSITGDIPVNLKRMLIGDQAPSFPVYRDGLISISVSGTLFTSQQLSDLADFLIAAGKTGGRWVLLVEIDGEKQYAPADKIALLRARSWDIVDWNTP